MSPDEFECRFPSPDAVDDVLVEIVVGEEARTAHLVSDAPAFESARSRSTTGLGCSSLRASHFSQTAPPKVGAIVRIRNSGYKRARIVEFRGPLGPKGARVYRIRVRKKPRPAYIEVLEDQLEVESAESD